MNWRVALIAAAGVVAVALLVWLLRGDAPVEVQQEVVPVAEIPEIPTPTPAQSRARAINFCVLFLFIACILLGKSQRVLRIQDPADQLRLILLYGTSCP